jgi:hypothetical protein
LAGAVWADSAFWAYDPNVTDGRDPDDGGIEDDSLSPAERIGDALSDWLHGDPRRRQCRFEPIELVVFAVVAGVALAIIATVINGFAFAGTQDVWGLLVVTTDWAQLPIAVFLLGAALLGWYQNERSCNAFEMYLNADETDQEATEDGKARSDINHAMSLLLRRLNRSHLAVGCIRVLALVTAAAAIVALISNLQQGGYRVWYGYLSEIALYVAAVIPAIACVILAQRAWTRGSHLLRADDTDQAVGDEPQPPGTLAH